MKEIEFGGCLFKFSDADGTLFLHTRDINGIDHTHAFPLAGAFLTTIGSGFWRFVTGAGPDAAARYLFDEAGMNAEDRVNALRELGVPVLGREEGKQNLEHHKLPVKRLVLAN